MGVTRPTGTPQTALTSSTTPAAPHAAPLALPLVQGSDARQGWSCGAHINRREIRRTSPGCAGRKQAVFSNKITVKPVLGKDLIGFETDIYGQVAMRVASLQGQLFLYRSIGCVAATKCATRPYEYAGDSHTAAHIRQPS